MDHKPFLCRLRRHLQAAELGVNYDDTHTRSGSVLLICSPQTVPRGMRSSRGANHTGPTPLYSSFPSVMIYRLPLPVIGTCRDPYKNIQLDPKSMPGGDVPTWRIQRQLIHLSAAPALSPRVYLATVSALRHLPCFIVTLTGAPLSVMVRASPTRPEWPL